MRINEIAASQNVALLEKDLHGKIYKHLQFVQARVRHFYLLYVNACTSTIFRLKKSMPEKELSIIPREIGLKTFIFW